MSSQTAFLTEDTQPKNKGADISSILFLSRYGRAWKWQFRAGFLLLFLSAATALGAGYLLGLFVSQGLLKSDLSRSLTYGAFVVLAECASAGFMFWGRRVLSVCSAQTILRIRRELFRQIQDLPLSYFDRQPLGRTVTRITHDVEGMEEFFSSSMARMVVSVMMALLSLLAMLLTAPRLGALTALTMIPAVALTLLTRGRARDLNRELSRRNTAINVRLSEYLNGIQVIRNFGLESWSKGNFDRVVEESLESSILLNEFYSWVRPFIEFTVQLPILSVLWFGGRAVLSGGLDVGVLVAFLRYADRFSRPMSELSREIHVIQQAFTSAERVSVFLKSPTENEELGANGKLEAGNLKGEISFRNVRMAYSKGSTVLADLSFEIKPGEKVGLAGATGSGKTSTVSLLARLYDFQDGQILIDGVDIRSYDRDSLRSRIGFVSQEVVIFKSDLRSNLDDSGVVTDAQIESACEQTGLLTVMQRRGLTLDSMILDKGANLSVGERQLVALTRVLLKKPSILIMDEATSNIDPDLEVIIHQAVNRLMSGRTALIIAHRLDTLQDCSKLLVFRSGRLAEQGSHGELLRADGYYAALLRGGEYNEAQIAE